MNYPRYPEYKPSGVEWLGKLPGHWEVKRLRFVAQINPTKSELNGLSEDTPVSFVPMDAVGEYGGLLLETEKTLDEVKNGYTYFVDGDVVLAKITPCFENGKGALAGGLLNGVGFGTTELHVLRPKPVLDRRFLFYFSIAYPFRKQGEFQMYGAGGQKRVPEEFIKDFRLGLPSVDEQRAIAAFLDRETARIDALIEKKQRFIELLQEKRAALISRAVTRGLDPNVPLKDSGVEWLGQIPAHWTVKPFRRCCAITEGQIDPKDDDFLETVLIAPNHIESDTGRILLTESAQEQGAISGKYPVRNGEIIYSKIRPALNKVCIAQGDWLCSADMYPIRCGKGLETTFLFYFLLSKSFVQLMVDESMRVAMPKVNRDTLMASPIIVPPDHEQRTIIEYLDRETVKLDMLRAKVESAIEKLKEYRAALIAAAVTGKIDVREA